MRAGLFNVLAGRFVNGTPVHTVDEREQRRLSVMDNLTYLFNTRQGSVAHLPDYGLPDLSSVYREVPYSIDGLKQIIQEIVQKYEPRLRHVRVMHQHSEKYTMRITFILSAEIEKGEYVKFQTTFTSNELVDISQYQDPE